MNVYKKNVAHSRNKSVTLVSTVPKQKTKIKAQIVIAIIKNVNINLRQ